MRRFFFIINLFVFSFYAFSQNALPDRIIGKIPAEDSVKNFQIQTGAYKLDVNAQNAINFLKKNNFNPVTEKYLDFTRVILKGVSAKQVKIYLNNLKLLGVNEVIIREDILLTISEKWEINLPESGYSSFEFNHDRNYIAVANDESMTAYFGTYVMPQPDTIIMDDIGTLRINDNYKTAVDFDFSPVDEPEKIINIAAIKSEKFIESSELNLICRTWMIMESSDNSLIGTIMLFSNAGTYFVTPADGKKGFMSKWRWYGDKNEYFEYSHNDWYSYGRAKINELSLNLLVFDDPGYLRYISGYSNAGSNNVCRLVPIRE